MYASGQIASPPAAVQFVGQIAFGIFAIVATVAAFDATWIAGVIVVLALGSIGFGGRSERRFGWRSDRARACMADRDEPAAEPAAPAQSAPAQTAMAPTGNAAFDAYRADVLKRLEDEQASFVGFLARLREARDKAELDRFMSERASSPVVVTPDLSDVAKPGEY